MPRHTFKTYNQMKKSFLFCLLLLAFAVFFTSQQDDAFRLLSFKQSSVDSDPNGVLSDWVVSSSSSSPCSWRGVLCSDNNRVISVNLTNAYLTGTLNLSDIMSISTLSDISLSGNYFYGTLSFSNCRNVNMLNFSGNKLTGNLSSSLYYCKYLMSLDLSDNQLSGDITTGFIPPSLKFLDLSGNKFTGKFQNLDFGACQNLTVINLSRNDLAGARFPASLTNCYLLQSLDISHNALNMKIPGVMLGGFKYLKSLSLAGNQFSGQIPPEVGNACSMLEELDL